MDVDTEVEEQEKDIVDTAISGDKKVQEGYESSDLELSSDSSEEESSDDSSSDEEVATATASSKPKQQQQRGEMLDDEEDEVFPDGVVKTAHEIVDIVVEKPQFELSPQTEIILAGNIFQIIDNVIVIHCRLGCEFSTLDQGSLLVYENREIMGEVFETFGPVARPYYSVRFNDAQEINAEFGKLGASVYYVPSYQKTQIVETEALKKFKGTDASNVYDEEVGEDEQEFSDDEMEMQAKKKRNREKKM
jgi:rRNA processing protein Gar1